MEKKYTISKRHGETPKVLNENGELSNLSPAEILPDIDFIGQNEILAIEHDENAKLKLIQRFASTTNQNDSTINEIKQKLERNAVDYIKTEEECEQFEVTAQQKPGLDEERRAYNDLGIENKLKQAKIIEHEQSIKTRIVEQFKIVKAWLDNYAGIFDLDFLSEQAIDSAHHKNIITDIRNTLEQLAKKLNENIKQSHIALEKAQEQYDSVSQDWEQRFEKIKAELDTAISKLPAHEGRSGREISEHYQGIIRKLTIIENQSKHRSQKQDELKNLQKEREVLLEQYRQAIFDRYNTIEKMAYAFSENQLKGKVKISVSCGTDRSALKQFLQENIAGIAKGKTAWLDSDGLSIDLTKWSEWIREKDAGKFMSEYGKSGLYSTFADKLCRLDTKQRLQLEEIELKDTVAIELNVSHDKKKENYVPLQNLSTGQKCTAILNLLLVSRDGPLIIDQPEDNLDNAFIVEHVVHDIRRLKTQRQFLFTTHNANIPVFGDAELIVVLKSNGEIGEIAHQGSVDKNEIQKKAADILEGGKDAFNMRKAKYGFEN